MPATEQPWRDQKILHAVFAGTGIVLLVSTVWMFAADHGREWKGIQRKARSIDEKVTQWRKLQEESNEKLREHERLSVELVRVRSQAPDASLFDQFKANVTHDAERRSVEVHGDFDETRTAFGLITERAALAAEKRQEAASADEQAGKAEELAAKAVATLTTARQSGAPEGEWNEAEVESRRTRAHGDEARRTAIDADVEAIEAESEAGQARQTFMDLLDGFVGRARFREDNALSARKFKAADYDAVKATLGLAVRDQKFDEEGELQVEVDAEKDELDALTLEYQVASAHRKELQKLFEKMTAAGRALEKELSDNRAELERLSAQVDERSLTYFTAKPPFLGKKLLTLPIIDAFGTPLKIDNKWTDGLTIPVGSFGSYRRFDRCTTCHQAIGKTAPGSATEPDYPQEQLLQFTVVTPELPIDQPSLASVYGITLAEEGLLDYDDVVINHVASRSLATKAVPVGDSSGVENGLMVGDVLYEINGDKVLSQGDAREFMVTSLDWGQPVVLTVRRGFPNPYSSHPRLNLFVGSLSPHPATRVGCTICHEGQGSGTEFKYCSHTPNTVPQARQWAQEYGWYDNHHWIFPMFPKRFAESACLKCHHDVVELASSERFPDPPAPKLMEGYHLITQYGCFGCHEIHGFKGPDRMGPDMRLEPNFYAAAAQLKADGGFGNLSDQVKGWIDEIAVRPELDSQRHRLMEFLGDDAESEEPQLTANSHKLAGLLKDVDNPGQLRKAGPSLRYVGDKLGREFLYDWVREPKHFRPSTKMPQFFGNWDHLHGEGLERDLELTKRYEAIEILGIVNYLINRSQSWEPVSDAEGVSESTSEQKVTRGKLLFETRGCLACHNHDDFPNAHATQGPNLTNLGDKFKIADTPNAKAWLVSWLRNPTNYHARTKMPDVYLRPIEGEDGSVTDPAEDIAEYLLACTSDWAPVAGTADALVPDARDLDGLALEHLVQAFFEEDAKTYLASGIPEEMVASLKGAEIELVGESSETTKLMYIGRKSISKYGCYACHDIPGFEDAKPIGTALTDWGRKDPSKLAFEHILEYLGHGHQHGHGGGSGHGNSGKASAGHSKSSPGDHTVHANSDLVDESFYHEHIEHHDRIGFIWQKLKEPRSYDYKKTTNKGYNERLRMPLFSFSDQQREAVVTFVLGLLAEPPAEQFVYQPTERRRAIVEGMAVLQKYNCKGCHIMESEKWQIEYEPGTFGQPPEVAVYPFVKAHMSSEELAATAEPHPQRGMFTTTLAGMPSISDQDALAIVLDEEGDPIEEGEEYDPDSLQYRFDLWEPATLDGNVFDVGVLPLTIPATMIRQKRVAEGGDLTKLLLPRAIELEREVNPSAKGSEAYGWLPPPLLGQGNKVNPDWLHGFLMDPFPIRPAVLLRMPRFNMSSGEASKLVNYFAAKDNVDYPYEFQVRQRSQHLANAANAYEEKLSEANGDRPEGSDRFAHAMRIVTDNNYCIKCHLVADFEPAGSDRAKAPDLSVVYRRLRPEFTRKWIANPKSTLPYTAMPVNIPYDPNAPHQGGVSQNLYHGTSTEQLDALVDLLMNFDTYTARQTSVADQVSPDQATAGSPALEAGASFDTRRLQITDEK